MSCIAQSSSMQIVSCLKIPPKILFTPVFGFGFDFGSGSDRLGFAFCGDGLLHDDFLRRQFIPAFAWPPDGGKLAQRIFLASFVDL